MSVLKSLFSAKQPIEASKDYYIHREETKMIEPNKPTNVLSVQRIQPPELAKTYAVYLHPEHKLLDDTGSCFLQLSNPADSKQSLCVVAFPNINMIDTTMIQLNRFQRSMLNLDEEEEDTPLNVLYKVIPKKKLPTASTVLIQMNWNRKACKLKISESDLEANFRKYHMGTLMDRKTRIHLAPSDYCTPEQLTKLPSNAVIELSVVYLESGKHKQESGGNEVSHAIITKETKLVFSGEYVQVNKLLKIKDISFESIGVGGLDTQFEELFRKLLMTRLVPKKVYEKFNLPHTKGVLLYGLPGTGKTRIARSLAKIINCKEPKLVNGPELLSKFVGESEKQMRMLFEDAEKNPEELHMIIFDEFDCIAKTRGSSSGAGGQVGDSLVNQLLSKVDGVNGINNVILVGLTNRKDLIDEAVLRPGRFEIHIEIGLPDKVGREQIFLIHTKTLRENGIIDEKFDWDVVELAERSENMTGAEIESAIKGAVSLALREIVQLDDIEGTAKQTENVHVTMDHLRMAVEEITPMFGRKNKHLEKILSVPFKELSVDYMNQVRQLHHYIDAFQSNSSKHFCSILIDGPVRSGKTYLAASVAKSLGNCQFIQFLSAEDMIMLPDSARMSKLIQLFQDAQKSESSCLIIDSVDVIVKWSPPNYFSNDLLQLMKSLLDTMVTKGKLLVLLTTNYYEELENKHLFDRVDVKFELGHSIKDE